MPAPPSTVQRPETTRSGPRQRGSRPPGEGGPLGHRTGDARREIEALRERNSTLSAAILRINATLDLDTVLAEVRREGARGLTGARYGVIATVDGRRARPRRNPCSPVSRQRKNRSSSPGPTNGRLFEHLRELPGPLRLADLSGYVRSLGIAPARTFSADLCRARRCATAARRSAVGCGGCPVRQQQRADDAS